VRLGSPIRTLSEFWDNPIYYNCCLNCLFIDKTPHPRLQKFKYHKIRIEDIVTNQSLVGFLKIINYTVEMRYR
jgi:hypothetical protein